VKAGLFQLLILLCVSAAGIGVHYLLTGSPIGPDLAAAAPILLFNQGMFALADRWRRRGGGEFSLFWGLVWIGGKLFVNCLTLFLLIGLQAVNIRVFVSVFFTGYLLILALGIRTLTLSYSGTNSVIHEC
jgi:cobalamin biosynthesis protein CobD/CbiB